MYKKLILPIICSFFYVLASTYNSLAHDISLDNLINTCNPTRQYINNYEPKKFSHTNNLLRNVGELEIFSGIKITLRGRVVDQQCVPISDAKVLIWHVNEKGKYPYIPLRSRIDNKLIAINKKSTFKGFGSATTNNQGEFIFITQYPGKVYEEREYVNLRVQYKGDQTLQTKIYLSQDIVEPLYSQPEFNYFMFSKVIYPFKNNVYQFQIVMPIKNNRLHF